MVENKVMGQNLGMYVQCTETVVRCCLETKAVIGI